MNPFDMLKNLSQMQSAFKNVQDKLQDVVATGSSGGNMVKITMNGKFELVDIVLDPICVDNRDVKMLQDLIIAAHNQAVQNVQGAIKDQLGPMLAGLDPSMLGM